LRSATDLFGAASATTAGHDGASRPTSRLRAAAAIALGLAASAAPSATQNAVANGDTRSLSFFHVHTGETATITYLRGGSYDSSALRDLNQLLRDWRNDQQTRMDPRLFDVLWEVQRAAGSRAPIEVLSAYRSPTTNAMLRRSSRGVAEHSQHTRGKAIDIHIKDVSLSRLRDAGMRLQRGGVGYYPRSNFVHLDTASVRHWPRMSYQQLVGLFPDGRTVHIPSNGQPLSGYEQALAQIEAGGGSAYALSYVNEQRGKGLFSWLFGGGEDESVEEAEARPARGRGKAARGRGGQSAGVAVAAYAPTGEDGGSRSFFSGMFSRQDNAEQTRVAALDTRAEARRRAEQQAAADREAKQREAQARALEAQNKAAEEKARALEAQAKLAEARAAQDKAKAAEAQQLRALAEETRALQEKTKADRDKLKILEESVVAEAKADPSMKRIEAQFGVAPLPPRRPSESVIASLGYADVPLPPLRPAELLAMRRVAALGEAGLPPIIAEGAGVSGLAGAGALAYAAPPEPVRRPPAAAIYRAEAPKAAKANLTPPRIDRAAFRTLTAETPSDRARTQATLAPTVTPLRAARRKTALAEGDVATRFGASPTGDLSATRFSGAAAAPLPRADRFGDLPLRLVPAEASKP
jgi:uncharacterized protein YcbK (DUF882 family)